MTIEEWKANIPCEEDGMVRCGRCKPKPFPAEVFVSEGDAGAFHSSPLCRALRIGQAAVRRRGGEPALVVPVHREVAIGRGAAPCLECFPEARGKA